MKKIDGSIKNQAIKFRKSGKSYNQISKRLTIAKSTLSYWFKQFPESESIRQKNILKSKIIWSRNIKKFNKKRAENYQRLVSTEIKHYASGIKRLNSNDLFFLAIGLYLAEGGKREKFRIKFTNSDPKLINIFLNFLLQHCQISKTEINCRIHLHNKNKYLEVLEYWSKITEISKDNFWQPQFLISNSSQKLRPKNRLPYGILQITVADSKLTRKIRGWSKGVVDQFLPT